LTGGFSVITAGYLRVIAEVPLVERLVPEARSAEEPTWGPGTGHLGITGARSAAGTAEITCRLNSEAISLSGESSGYEMLLSSSVKRASIRSSLRETRINIPTAAPTIATTTPSNPKIALVTRIPPKIDTFTDVWRFLPY